MKHPGWKIEIRYTWGQPTEWKDFWNPENFHSKKSMESCVRQNLSSGMYGREYRVVEKDAFQEDEYK